VVELPTTHYTRSADGTNLTYQVSGGGPLDLVFLHGNAIPIDPLSEEPGFIRLRKRLDTFSHTLWFEARGFGASEGDARGSIDEEMISDADLTAVLDAVGFQRAAFVAENGSGVAAIRYSVAHPERVSALVLLNCAAHYVREDDYPFGVSRETLDRLVTAVRDDWGTGRSVEMMAPSRIGDERFRAWCARSERAGGGPDLVAHTTRAILEADVRPLLPRISVPTLVLNREGDRLIRLGAGRYLAEHIPDAKFVVLPGEDHLFFVGDTDAWVDEIEDFLTGVRSGAEGEVVLAAVLFTDIVASTEHQARLRPREWSRLADHHDAMVRAALAHYRGREVKTTGDGFLATFDATGRALRCAAEVVAGAKDIGLDLRAGVHAGEVEIRGDDLGGLAVTIAKRVCDLARPGHVLVSETVRGHMVGSGLNFNDEGEHELKGVPGSWRLFTVVD
jgi:class 3 adenylate cyclase/pimeloyl-ACP methyl ester carboxylesterase